MYGLQGMHKKINEADQKKFTLISAQLLGFENPIPPYATARGPEILKGLNYASGGGGIRAETSYQQVNLLINHNKHDLYYNIVHMQNLISIN